MSWSVSAIGKPAAVAAKLAKDFANITCPEPEQTIKNKLAETVALSLAVFPPNLVVKVDGNGSQYAPSSAKPTEIQNTFKFEVNIVYNFVE